MHGGDTASPHVPSVQVEPGSQPPPGVHGQPGEPTAQPWAHVPSSQTRPGSQAPPPVHWHSSEPTGHGGGRSGPGVEVDEVVGAVPVVGPASVDVVDGAPVDVVGDPSVVVWEAGGQAQRRAATMMGLRMRRGYD